MLYYVSAQITFDTAAHATTAYNKIQSFWPLTSGRHDDQPPKLTVGRDGAKVLAFTARLSSKAVRDALKDWLMDHRDWIKANTHGYISYHPCRHDTDEACRDDTIVEWGTPDV